MDSLSIVIPAYNEEHRLPKTLDRIVEWVEQRRFPFAEVIVVDDGSSDRTAAVVEDYRKTHASVRLLRNPGNRGKGYAVRHGMLEAAGEWVLYTDADLSAPIEEFDKLCQAAMASGAMIAIGSRAVDRSLVSVHQSPFREFSGRFFNLLMRAVTGLPFRDTQCGFKLYRADAARQIFALQKQDGFSFDVEDLLIAKKLALRAVEVPVRWANVEGTKVRLSQGVRSFLDLVRIRMDHRKE
ncbi:MAG TPA: dolichyl-phosphate beta-glucosyltransferase [Bryobacteraceae bacterium]|nr:dolichyl-phosphate beta-glucosyltransferase [Bryobacteraceae bacterium]